MKSVVLVIILFSIGCKGHKTADLNAQHAASIGTMHIVLEGKEYNFDQVSKLNSTAAFKEGIIEFYLTKDGAPVSVNFNLHNTDVLEKESTIYIIPDANNGTAMVDLSFFNAKREGKQMNKRIVFRKGEINIVQISTSRLEMSFKGEGGPMMDRALSFPISGTIDITLSQ